MGKRFGMCQVKWNSTSFLRNAPPCGRVCETGVRTFRFWLSTVTDSEWCFSLKFRGRASPGLMFSMLSACRSFHSTSSWTPIPWPSPHWPSSHSSLPRKQIPRSGQKPLGACLCAWLWAWLQFMVFRSKQEPLSAERQGMSVLSLSPHKGEVQLGGLGSLISPCKLRRIQFTWE